MAEEDFTVDFAESEEFSRYTEMLSKRLAETKITPRPFSVFIHNGVMYPAWFLDVFPCAFIDSNNVSETD